VVVEYLAPIQPESRWLPDLPHLEPNRKLLYAEHLFRGQWVGPEALALDPSKKMLYTGLLDGRIVRWDGKSQSYEEFVRTGEKLSNCGERQVEHICGRPLGLHFDASGHLLVADAYKGLLSISPEGRITTLMTSVEGQPLRFTNDLAIGDDGTIYVTDSSIYERRNYLLDLLESRGRGRLVAYYASNGTSKVLLKDLYFPNGITWHSDKRSLLVVELNKFRILRYYVATGKVEVFSDNLFGTPDNIRPREVNGKNHYLVGMGLRRSHPISFLQMLGPLPYIRALLAFFPPAIVVGTMSPYGIVAELNDEGKVVDTYQDPTGHTGWLSEAMEWDGYLYLASFANPFLARIPLASL